ncbi:MAG: GNAT family N-acetyltransferase [Gammaproteobacteria bacterium]|nr:GNAT family N-acetyltransferase [Gammaproteobacteria bacterium]
MIRKAEFKDIKRLNELLSDVHEIHYQGRPDIFKDGVNKYSDEELKEIIVNPLSPIYVYTDESNQTIAYMFLIFRKVDNEMLEPIRYLYIDDLCVDKAHRNKGIGKKLLDFTNVVAKENNIKYIRLNLWALNDGAKDFYFDNGYEVLHTMLEKRIK